MSFKMSVIEVVIVSMKVRPIYMMVPFMLSLTSFPGSPHIIIVQRLLLCVLLRL